MEFHRNAIWRDSRKKLRNCKTVKRLRIVRRVGRKCTLPGLRRNIVQQRLSMFNTAPSITDNCRFQCQPRERWVGDGVKCDATEICIFSLGEKLSKKCLCSTGEMLCDTDTCTGTFVFFYQIYNKRKKILKLMLHRRNWFCACQIVYQKLSFLQYIGGNSCNNKAGKKSRRKKQSHWCCFSPCESRKS